MAPSFPANSARSSSPHAFVAQLSSAELKSTMVDIKWDATLEPPPCPTLRASSPHLWYAFLISAQGQGTRRKADSLGTQSGYVLWPGRALSPRPRHTRLRCDMTLAFDMSPLPLGTELFLNATLFLWNLSNEPEHSPQKRFHPALNYFLELLVFSLTSLLFRGITLLRTRTVVIIFDMARSRNDGYRPSSPSCHAMSCAWPLPRPTGGVMTSSSILPTSLLSCRDFTGIIDHIFVSSGERGGPTVRSFLRLPSGADVGSVRSAADTAAAGRSGMARESGRERTDFGPIPDVDFGSDHLALGVELCMY